MKNMKRVLLIFVLLISIFTMTFYSFAKSDEYDVKMKSSKNKYGSGDIVNITVSIENIKVKDGIAACSAILDYDDSIFEDVSVQAIDEWDTPILLDNMIQATRKDIMNSKEDQKIMSISLKVKENAKPVHTSISLTKFDATNGEETIKNDGASMDIEIVQGDVAQSTVENEVTSYTNIIIGVIIALIVIIVVIAVILKKKNKKKK